MRLAELLTQLDGRTAALLFLLLASSFGLSDNLRSHLPVLPWFMELKTTIRNLGFTVKGIFMTPTPAAQISQRLTEAAIPVSDDPCRGCADPCDVGHLEYPPRFDVDHTSDLLGSCKPYSRQVLISTGKSDWGREVTEVDETLAAYLSAAQSKLLPSSSGEPPNPSTPDPASPPVSLPGVFVNTEMKRLGVINGSHNTLSEEGNETCIVLPDYTLWLEVPPTSEGAETLWKSALDPAYPRTGVGKTGLKCYTIPFNCVVLLCSHKRRDNRCAIAAVKLEQGLCHTLESEGWEVHTDIKEHCALGSPLPETEDAGREEVFVKQVKALEGADQKKALILKISHIGGHKYAGNVIIYTPQGPGSGVWYGRVTPHEVEAVVKHTIIEGKVLPPLFRGGVNLSRATGKSLLDW